MCDKRGNIQLISASKNRWQTKVSYYHTDIREIITTFHNAFTNTSGLQETGHQTAIRFPIPQFKRILHETFDLDQDSVDDDPPLSRHIK